ncbi:MAG: hypothetical protein AAGU17_09780 [Anaerolineaceae bacterium]|jgi:hypothetical protein
MSATLDNKRIKGYPLYPSIIAGGSWALVNRLLGRRLIFGEYAHGLVQRVSPTVERTGAENILPDGGYVVTVNHYAREGFSSAWIAIAVSGVIPAEVTWIMTEEWVFQGHPLARMLRPAMRFVLSSVQKTYGFLPMPTMAAGYSEVAQRSAAVRRVIGYVRRNPQAVIGIAPEGRDSPHAGMGDLPTGVGKFILHLNRMGLRVLPVAITEHNGRMRVNIGAAYDLALPDAGVDLDAQARAIIREKIGRLIGQ